MINLKSLPLIFLVVFAVSCDDEQSQPKPSGNVISFSLAWPRSNYWVVFSDANGKILYAKSAEHTDDFVLTGLPDTKANITLIERSEYDGYEWWKVKTYTDVSRGEYQEKFPLTEYPVRAGDHTVVMPDKSLYYGLSFNANEICGHAYPIDDGSRMKVGLCNETEKIYTVYTKSLADIPKYSFLDMNVGGETVLDEAALNTFTEMSYKTIRGNDGQGVTASIFGISGIKTVNLWSVWGAGDTRLYYPGTVTPGRFDAYKTTIAVSFSNGQHEFVNTSPEIDVEYSPLEIDLKTIPLKQFPQLQFTTTGQAHYYEAKLTELAENRSIVWSVYGDVSAVTDIKLPDINTFLEDQVVSSGLRCRELIFTENAIIQDYEQFYVFDLQLPIPELNIRRARFYVNE